MFWGELPVVYRYINLQLHYQDQTPSGVAPKTENTSSPFTSTIQVSSQLNFFVNLPFFSELLQMNAGLVYMYNRKPLALCIVMKIVLGGQRLLKTSCRKLKLIS